MRACALGVALGPFCFRKLARACLCTASAMHLLCRDAGFLHALALTSCHAPPRNGQRVLASSLGGQSSCSLPVANPPVSDHALLTGNLLCPAHDK